MLSNALRILQTHLYTLDRSQSTVELRERVFWELLRVYKCLTYKCVSRALSSTACTLSNALKSASDLSDALSKQTGPTTLELFQGTLVQSRTLSRRTSTPLNTLKAGLYALERSQEASYISKSANTNFHALKRSQNTPSTPVAPPNNNKYLFQAPKGVTYLGTLFRFPAKMAGDTYLDVRFRPPGGVHSRTL